MHTVNTERNKTMFIVSGNLRVVEPMKYSLDSVEQPNTTEI